MRDLATRLVLSPVLAAQAIAVRRRAQKLPEADGPREGSQGSGPCLRLRIIGDSSAAGVGAPDQTQALAGQLVAQLAQEFAVSWHLDAITGATTRSTLRRLEQRDAAPADVIVTALGVNDVTRQVPPWLWRRQQDALLARLRVLYAPRHIFLSGIAPLDHFPLLPNPLRWTLARQAVAMERTLRAHVVGMPDVTHVPFNATPRPELMASDGFHPSPLLYKLWAQEMAGRIRTGWPFE